MKMVKSKLALGAAVAALALAGTVANAAVNASSPTPYDSAPGAGETMIMNFDDIMSPAYSIVPGDTVTAGTTVNEYAAPAGDGTTYYYVQGGAAATLTGQQFNSMSLYIGSLDDYNSITFYYKGALVGSWSGADFAPANGDQGSAATNRRFTFDFGGGRADKVVFASSSNSFEFDNIAVSAVPEPGVWALMIAGFGMMGAALRRRRTVAGVLA